MVGNDPGAPAEARARPPAWYRLVPFLGRPPPLSERQWRVLGLVSVVSFFENYDMYLFALNLSRIQTELGIDDAQLGWLGSVVRAGAFFAFLVTIAADRYGRRRLLLFTVIAYTLLTAATAFAPTAEAFVVLQFLARIFASAETLLAFVVIAEEFDAQHRGWGIGALGAIMSVGAGAAAGMFSLVDVLPFGWRALYLFGIAPLVLVAWWRRAMPETERFVQLQRERKDTLRATPAFAPALELIRSYPGRFAAVAIAVFVLAAASSPAGFFAPTYLQSEHGWAASSVALLNVFGGAFGIVGNPVAGWLSDRYGRRPITIVFVLGLGAVTLAFYSASGWVLVPLWILMIFGSMGATVTLAAFGAELFPTSSRSTASGARAAADAVGAVLGLGLVSVLYTVVDSNWTAISLLCLGIFAVPFIVALAFPETAGRSLEEISGAPAERDDSGERSAIGG